MKKYITIILVILFSVTFYGQQTVIKVRDYDYYAYFGDRRCAELIQVTAFFKGGGSEQFISYEKGSFIKGTGNGNYILNGIVERVELYAFARDAADEVVSTSCRKGKNVERTQKIDIPLDPCSIKSFNIVHNHDSDLRQRISFTLEAISVPEVSRATASNLAGYEDPINITASANYNNSVYNWQYGIENGVEQYLCDFFPPRFCTRPKYDWFELSIPNDQNASIVLKDFLTEDIIGEEIFFRIQSCNQETSNIIGYQVRKSAPHIIAISTKDVTCYDSIDDSGNGDGDGSITLTFDRPLDPLKDDVYFSVIDLRAPSVVKNDDNITSFGSGNTHTISGLPASTPGIGFRVDVLGFYNSINYYTEGPDHSREFEIQRPTPVAFVGEPNEDANKVDVWCINGSDGTIDLVAQGGVEGYEYLVRLKGEVWDETKWISFSSQFTHTISGLSANTYEIKIRDANECEAKDQIDVGGEIKLGDVIVKEVVIDEPDAPVDLELTLINEPRAFGFEDGRISARIFGGTPLNDGSYTFEWKNQAGEVLTSTITNVLPGNQGYQVLLHSIGKGVYKLSAWDANFNPAIDKEGCFLVDIEYNLGEPDPLEVAIEIYNPISCNIDNEYSNGVDFNDPLGIPDQFQDGALVAHVKGGVAFDNTIANTGECRANFMPYCYRWKKNIGGVWQDITVNDSIIENQSVGTYALNVEDKNGIILATYEEFISPDGSREYRVVTEIDSTKYLPQPDKLEISFTNTVVTCANGDDAQATVIVTGGTSPYTYEWSNGKTTATIQNLFSGTYLVFVTDAKGCQIEGRVKIVQPNGLEINPVSIINPTCFEGNDGKIEVEVTGGNPPYRYSWNTSNTTTSIDGLASGIYRIEVIDNKECKAFYEVNLTDPDPIIVNLEDKRSLCNDQFLYLDIAINDPGATYSWSSQNGFASTDSAVEITKAGRYVATITSSLGCIGIKDIEVEVLDIPIDSDFLITTQTYTDEEVILVNVSEPMGEKIEWTIPDGVEVISESKEKLILKFDQEGPYDINLRSYQKDCYQDFAKTILVQPAIKSPEIFTSQGEFIEEFIVYPNPNNGVFKTKISLAEDSNITVKIINLMSGATMSERSEKNNRDFLLDYSIALPAGVYLLLLETPKGTATRKLVFE
ncbi:T9SS type A sorting domain-containing protein [Aquimarina muelleri]|uniref:T9SS type A sorting domain-containing protein n=1 Tax=Aquimarina muelleri TaxID=279356 RepID=UPI003F684E22